MYQSDDGQFDLGCKRAIPLYWELLPETSSSALARAKGSHSASIIPIQELR